MQFAALLKLLVFNKVESFISVLLYNSFSSHILVMKNLAGTEAYPFCCHVVELVTCLGKVHCFAFNIL